MDQDTLNICLDSMTKQTVEAPLLSESAFTVNPISNWIPFLSAIIGGLLVLGGQAIDRYTRSKKERVKEFRVIASNCKSLELILTSLFTDLARYKTHVQYWWWAHEKEGEQKTYELHLSSLDKQFECENKIWERIAEYGGLIKNLSLIDSKYESMNVQLSEIQNIEFRKAHEYPSSDNSDDVRQNKVIKDEKELKEEYHLNLKIIKELNMQMKS